MNLLKYDFVNKNFQYSLFFQEYFKNVRGVDNSHVHLEHDEYTCFFNAILGLVPKDKLIIDVGANSGLFCIPLCLYGYDVIGFEPVQSNIDCLNMGIESNSLKNLKISSYALSNENIESEIYVPNSQDNASLIKDVSTSNLVDKEITSENIKCIKLDDYIKSENIDPKSIGHIKIDVQGYELKVIEGMTNILKESDDISLIIEWDMNHSGSESLNRISELLNQNSMKEIIRPGIVTGENGGNKIFKKIIT
jgi:FkbM family methyltransferase